LFTIIIPTFNSSALINKCLESICGQTFNNYEVIIVDGLSNDDTLQIVETYRNKLPYLKISSEKDKGIYDAMNKGISLAQGEWLYFMGSDDYFYSNDVLNKIYNQIDQKTDVLYGNVFDEKRNGLYDGQFTGTKLFFMNICHQSIFYKKNIFKKLGNYSLNYTCWADWEHNFRWFYNKEINKKYVDLTVAFYSTGGFSSKVVEDKFKKEKLHLYFLLTRKKIKFVNIIQFYYSLRIFLKEKQSLK
jgi:glycosyltransferase involved in cell wall biosynthesis